MAIRVVVVDDHVVFRRGVTAVLEGVSDVCVVGEAPDGLAACEVVADQRPDVVLMDVNMPRLDGVQATAALQETGSSARVVMLTVSDDEGVLRAALQAGAHGYLLKSNGAAEIRDAIVTVSEGGSAVCATMAKKLITDFTALLGHRNGERLAHPRLTDREIEVLTLVAHGLRSRDIAGQLFIAENTVKNHIRSILEKLQVHSRMEAVVLAVREGLLEIK